MRYTNFNAALKKAAEIWNAAIKGDLSKFIPELSNVRLIHQDVLVTDKNISVSIPNLRIFLYSDGEHNYPTPEIENPFENISFVEGINNVSGLMTVYFGKPYENGAKQMEKIAGICPIHNLKGYFSFNSRDSYPTLKGFIRVASGASGFCPECIK